MNAVEAGPLGCSYERGMPEYEKAPENRGLSLGFERWA